jgi:acetyl esterase/lipase
VIRLCQLAHTLPQVPASRRPRPHADTDYLLDTPEPRALLSRTFLGHHPIEMVYSPYISPASEWVLSVFHGQDGLVDLEPLGPHQDSRDYRDEGIKAYDCAAKGAPSCSDGRSAANNPYIRLPPGMGLFTDFPRALVVVGDAERLEREVAALERALEYDGVRVRMVWAKDAVHDILIMAAWDERVREGIWKEIGRWIHEVATE